MNPARPGATEAGQCHGEKNPVWARVWAREKSCSEGIQFQAKRFLPLVEMTEKAISGELLRWLMIVISHLFVWQMHDA